MKKIPTLFVRDEGTNRKYVKNEVIDGCQWVLDGEGVATRKYDGTCCMLRDGVLYKRREVKKGKPTPPGFEQEDYDETTGKTVGWLLVGDGPEDALARETYTANVVSLDGTYELCGPKVNGNPEGFNAHYLVPHNEAELLPDAPRDFDSLATWLGSHSFEGIVWHHPDGRMVKLKKRDFPQADLGRSVSP